jgi:hypothetical protein
MECETCLIETMSNVLLLAGLSHQNLVCAAQDKLPCWAVAQIDDQEKHVAETR